MTTTLLNKATFDSFLTPRVTIERSGGGFLAVIDGIDGIDPQRSVEPGADGSFGAEWALGIRSLNPPTVVAKTHRELIDISQRAVQSAISSTTGERGGPGAILLVYFRTAIAVRACLRKLGEDI